MTYCAKSGIKVDVLLKACRFGYCICFPNAKVEYCYECDDFRYGDEK